MTHEEYKKLTEIANNPKPWLITQELRNFLLSVKPEMPRSDVKTPRRTDSQHKALFLWFSMIEHEAANAGITWNQVVGQTHQLKITKEGLHVMAKQLSEALWGIKSTKDLKKTGHIDDLIDHFTDLFSKVGLELPVFPSDEQRAIEENQGYKLGHTPENYEYPENGSGEVKF